MFQAGARILYKAFVVKEFKVVVWGCLDTDP